jgi:triacylglycerol esterase/lipase EstA (alpha/beta hydrolase family)
MGTMRLLDRMVLRARRSIAEVSDAAALNRVERRTDLDAHPHPVLLLHGFFSTRRTFDVLEARLRRDGFGVFSLNLGGLKRAYNTRGIDDLADYVRAKVERIYARHPNLGPLTIIGHSKGGLVATYYVKKLGGWRRTRAVVMMGTPFHGTPMAWLGLPVALLAPSLVQLLPGSRFLRRLHEGRWPPQVRLTSIWSKKDRLAVWPSATLETSDQPQWRNLEVDCFHFEFLTRKRIYAVLRRELASLDAPRRPSFGVVAGGQAG